MNIIINNSSMHPIYEQIVDQIKQGILHGHFLPEQSLPSVRSLAKELHISALTVKKAYDTLEAEGFITTIHGKGSFIAGLNRQLAAEEQRKELEMELTALIKKGRTYGLSTDELRQTFELLLEEI